MDGGNALLVQYMGLGPAVEAGNARKPGIVAELVYVGGVHGVHGLAVFFAQLIGQHDPQLGRVVAAPQVLGRVLHQAAVNDHDPGLLGVGAASPAHEHVYVRRRHAVVFQKLMEDLHAHGHLVVGGGVLQQLRSIVEYGLGIDVFFVFKIAHLGRGGAGVDDE